LRPSVLISLGSWSWRHTNCFTFHPGPMLKSHRKRQPWRSTVLPRRGFTVTISLTTLGRPRAHPNISRYKIVNKLKNTRGPASVEREKSRLRVRWILRHSHRRIVRTALSIVTTRDFTEASSPLIGSSDAQPSAERSNGEQRRVAASCGSGHRPRFARKRFSCRTAQAFTMSREAM
jgi:hypothetical protein